MQESFYAFLTLGLLSEIKGKAGLESGNTYNFPMSGRYRLSRRKQVIEKQFDVPVTFPSAPINLLSMS